MQKKMGRRCGIKMRKRLRRRRRCRRRREEATDG